MISSMTGFGSGSAGEGAAALSVEVKTVNHRGCDVKIRMPSDLAALEGDVAKLVRERVQRGAVEVSVKRPKGVGESGPLTLKVNADLARAYADAASEVARSLGMDAQLDLRAILSFDGVLTREVMTVSLEELRASLFTALESALSSLAAMRRNEGISLAADFQRRLAFIQSRVDQVRELSPKTVASYRERLDERILELTKGIPLDPQRLAQEVAVFADRIDVAEEVTRLDAHLKAFAAMLERSEATGRSMDFLVQEINRETNTIGSKSQSSEIAAIVIEMKAEIERIREQVQNVL